MKSPLLHKLLSEWERTLLAVVAAVACLATVLALLNFLAEDEMTIQTNNTIPPMPNYLNRSPQKALETPAEHLPPETGNPFAFEKPTIPKQAPPPKPQAQPQNGNKPQPQAQNGNQPQQQPQQNPKQPAANQPAQNNNTPAKPTPPPRTLTVTYRGLVEAGDAKKVAFLTTVDSLKNQTNTLTLLPGAEILPKVSILSADQKELKISTNGNTITIPNGGKSTFQIE